MGSLPDALVAAAATFATGCAAVVVSIVVGVYRWLNKKEIR